MLQLIVLIHLFSWTDAKKYYENHLLEIRRQAPNPAALCSALIENSALQLVGEQNSQWRLHSAKQVNFIVTIRNGYLILWDVDLVVECYM